MKLIQLTKPFAAVLLLCSFLGGCAVLSDSQVKNINVFAATAKGYCSFPSAVVRQRADLHLANELLVASQFTDADQINHRLDTARKSYNSSVQLSTQFDLSLQLIQRYAGLLTKLSSDQYITDLNTPTAALGEHLGQLVTQYNSIVKDTLPAGLSVGISKVILLIGKELTKKKQTEALKEFVLAADPMIQVTTRNLVAALDGDSFTDGAGNTLPTFQLLLSLERDQFVQSYRYVVFAKTAKIDYVSVKFYYDELTDYDNTEALRMDIVKAARSLAQAHATLAKDVQTKKDLKEIFGETQQLITDVQSAGSVFSKMIKLP